MKEFFCLKKKKNKRINSTKKREERQRVRKKDIYIYIEKRKEISLMFFLTSSYHQNILH